MDEKPEGKGLRSREWFARQDKMGFYYRSWLRNRGLPDDQFDGRPVVGICNTWSELTPCNGHFRTIAEHVRHGILEAGGYPLEFPVLSLGETQMRPTAMLYRNLASMDVEEALRANPLDGVEPPIAARVRIAFSKACRVRIFDMRMSSRTISTIRRPVS